MLRIGILGTPVSAGNRGVLALGASLVNLCMSSGAETTVTLFLGHRDNKPASFRVGGESRTVPIVNYRLSPRARLRDHLAWIVFASLLYRWVPLNLFRRALSRATPWIAALESMDFVGDVRGGDSFSDIYGLKVFIYGFVEAWTVLLIKGTMVQFPQTYGPYKSPLARRLARYLLKRSSVVIARDKESQNLAKDILGPGGNVWLSPDVAFALGTVEPTEIGFDPPLPYRYSTVNCSVGPARSPEGPQHVGVNVSGLLFNGGYTRDNMFGLKLDYPVFLNSMIVALLREHPGDVWLIPHTYGRRPDSVEDDVTACRLVRAALAPEFRERVNLVTREYDCHEIKHIIGECEFFIGSRMHACIAALSQGIPTVGVAYSKKFAGVFDSVGMKEWVVDAREISNHDAVARTVELFRSRHLVLANLRRECEVARGQLDQVFKRLAMASRPAAGFRAESAEVLERTAGFRPSDA